MSYKYFRSVVQFHITNKKWLAKYKSLKEVQEYFLESGQVREKIEWGCNSTISKTNQLARPYSHAVQSGISNSMLNIQNGMVLNKQEIVVLEDEANHKDLKK